jgi:plastocyanin
MPAKALIALALLVFACAVATAGEIRGRVTAQGRELPGGAAGGAYGSKKFKFLEKIDYSEMRDFVVHIVGPASAGAPAEALTRRVVVQENAMFSPRVLPVAVGTTVEWPNEDDIFHNVFSFSDPKPFDLGLYREEIKKLTFDQPGRVDVFCSIHKEMHCIILVLENPWFAAADESGRYRIAEVPPGDYELRAWHERLPPQTRRITVPAHGIVEANFTLGVTGLPQY